MSTQQLILSLLLATMVFSVALEVKPNDFRRVMQTPKAVLCGLIQQFILLPVGTWLAKLTLDLPPNIEVAMILVASFPGGSLSNVVTHFGRGNMALSASISAAASLIALVATPFNFSWMVANNPNTASWLKVLAINPSDIWISLVLLLALPMSLGLIVATRFPVFTAKIQKPLANFALFMLLAFIVAGLLKDRQVTWDDNFTPSIYHGVTTVMMGNCGVGFAPKRPGGEEALIKLMEGVEDIPGAALHEGIKWDWESFLQYMDALAKTPRSLDYLVQVPHDPLRMYVMGERAVARQVATAQDINAMRDLVHDALKAGAAGFSTGRSDNHRTSEGKETPAAEAGAAELAGIAKAFDGLSHGVVQMVNDFDLLRGTPDDVDGAAKRFNAEFDLVEQLARAAGKPLSMTWLQRDPGGKQFEAIQARVDTAVSQGLPLYLQTAARGIGVINGLDASFHLFMGAPAYKEVAHLPLAERAAALREPSRKSRVLSEKTDAIAGDSTDVPPLVDILLARIDLISASMFPLEGSLDHEPSVMQSFFVQAKQKGIKPLEAIFDHLCAGDGSNLLYSPSSITTTVS